MVLFNIVYYFFIRKKIIRWDCENLEWYKINLSSVKLKIGVKNNLLDYLVFFV